MGQGEKTLLRLLDNELFSSKGLLRIMAFFGLDFFLFFVVSLC